MPGRRTIGNGPGYRSDRKSEDTSTLNIDLVPPKPQMTLAGQDISNLGITNAILDVRRQLASGMSQDPPLTPTNVTITLKFVVTTSGSGSLEAKYLIVSVNAGGSLSSALTNSITLSFSKPKAP